MGRPREFELTDAIDTATDLFWKNGYDGTSLSDLTKAIGISTPSFYFAFGSKEGLFRKVIERYFAEQTGIAEAALRQSTPRAVAKHFLNSYADLLTDPRHAPGCLAMNSALPCAEGDPLRQWLADLRDQMRKRLRDRFEEAPGGEGLPAGMDTDSLARLVLMIAWGMAVEAQSGAILRRGRGPSASMRPAPRHRAFITAPFRRARGFRSCCSKTGCPPAVSTKSRRGRSPTSHATTRSPLSRRPCRSTTRTSDPLPQRPLPAATCRRRPGAGPQALQPWVDFVTACVPSRPHVRRTPPPPQPPA